MKGKFMKTIRFLAVALCIFLLAGICVFADTQEQTKIVFSDVAEDAPYAKQVQKLVENGVLSGHAKRLPLPTTNHQQLTTNNQQPTTNN